MNVHEGITDHHWVSKIQGALKVQVIQEYLDIWEKVEAFSLQPGRKNNLFVAGLQTVSIRRLLLTEQSSLEQFTWQVQKNFWKVRAPPKLKFFVWLVLQDRCWTAQHRKRHKLQGP